MQMEAQPVTALLLDGWLPDLEVREFAAHVRLLYPEIEQVHLVGAAGESNDPREVRAACGSMNCCMWFARRRRG